MTIHDVQLDEHGDLPALTRHVSGVDLIRQRIKTRLQTFAGEWFLDERRGLPYLEWKQARPADVAPIRARLRRDIVTTPGVIRVEDLAVTFTDGIIRARGTIFVEDQQLSLDAEIGALPGNSQPVTVLLLAS